MRILRMINSEMDEMDRMDELDRDRQFPWLRRGLRGAMSILRMIHLRDRRPRPKTGTFRSVVGPVPSPVISIFIVNG